MFVYTCTMSFALSYRDAGFILSKEYFYYRLKKCIFIMQLLSHKQVVERVV